MGNETIDIREKDDTLIRSNIQSGFDGFNYDDNLLMSLFNSLV